MGYLFIASQGWKTTSLSEGGTIYFSMMLAGAEQLLSTSFLPYEAAAFLAFSLERRPLMELYFYLYMLCFSVAGFFNSKCGIYEVKKNPRELTVVSSFLVDLTALHLSEPSCVCFVYTLWSF